MKAADLYDPDSRLSDGGYTDVEPIAYDDPKIAYVVARARGKRVLDLGCVMHDPNEYRSRYFLHRAIREVAEETLGLDLHEQGVEALNALGFQAIVGDAEHFALDRQFDTIVAGDLIEHLGNVEGFLKSVMGCLAPDGKLVIQTPNPWYWKNSAKAVLNEEVPNNPEHTCWFDPRTLRQLAARFGLELTAVEFQSRSRKDRWLPLPRGLRHTSWSAELVRSGSDGP